jgi:Holliday junction resolvasome RuvABC endonuclease subunit
MKILALDLSGQTGWALWSPGFEAPLFGVAKLPKGSPGATFFAFRNWLVGKIVGDQVDHLVIESIFVGQGMVSALPRLYGLMGVAQEVAHGRGVSTNVVTVMEWRGAFIGTTKAPKGLEKDKRRLWLKNQTREECANRGWPTKTDDEADALGLLVYERARLFPKYGQDGPLFGFQP